MELHITAWILINWLLAIAWLDPSKAGYALWAGVVVFLWWTAWYHRNPPWPLPSRRMLIYPIFLATVLGYAFFIGRWQAYFVLLEIIALWIGEALLRRRAT